MATAPFRGIAGFHLNELYSPWVAWSEMVDDFLIAKRGGRETLKVWVNTALGEAWEEKGEKLDESALRDRAEAYPLEESEQTREVIRLLPKKVVVLTAGIDTQDDRLEVLIEGWGEHEECWIIDMIRLWGDPAGGTVLDDLDDLLCQRWKHVDGDSLVIASACFDIAGHRTDYVFDFVRGCTIGKRRFRGKVFAVRGSTQPGSPIVGGTRRQKKRGGIPLTNVGTVTAKDTIFSRLKLTQPGPNYIHFSDHLDDEFYSQLTAEVARTKRIKGRAYRHYEQIRERNEALDCKVYSLAALRMLRRDVRRFLSMMNARRDTLRKRGGQAKEEPEETRPNTFVKRRRGWATRW